jgi:hypothetical protein
MRYPAAEKVEIIRLVEQSALPVRRTLGKIGIPRASFYRWYDLYRTGGPEAMTTDLPGRTASGTAFQTPSANGSFSWHWTSPHCRLGNWPRIACTSPGGCREQVVPTTSRELQNSSRQARKKRKQITNIDDLDGRRIGVAGPANIELLYAILAEYQVAKDQVTIVPLDPRDIAGSLHGKTVDVLFAVGSVGSPVLADAIASARNGKLQPALLSVGASEAIAARRPVYESAEIKAGVLGGQPPLPEEAIETVSVKHYVIARTALIEGTVAEFTRLLFDARQHLAANHPSFAKLEKPDTDRDAAVAAHPGAIAFLDNDQKTFLDKYSDLIYLGLMLLSGFGSAAAWLLSHGRKDNRLQRLKVLDRLGEIVKLARVAPTTDDLARFRTEIDDILGRVVDQAERNEIAESSVRAFALALDQAQLAVSERRAEITGSPQLDGMRSGPANLRVVRGEDSVTPGAI